MFKKIAAFALVAALGVMTLTGCGGDAAKEGTETQTETTESTDGGSTDANADADAADSADTTDTAAAGGEKVRVIDVDLSSEQYAFGVDKDQPELLQQTNDFIDEIMGNGEFDKICNNYFGDGKPQAVTSAARDDSKDQLVVATNAAFEPFEYTKGDKYLGIDMEIADALAKKLGKELVIENMDFDAVCLSVGQHKCDIAMAGLTIKESRKKYVEFSSSYYNASQRIIVKADDTTFDSAKDADAVHKILTGFDSATKVGVQNGTTGKLYCEGDEEAGFEKLPVTTVGYKNGSLAVMDLINGNLDYVVIDAAPAKCITDAMNAQ